MVVDLFLKLISAVVTTLLSVLPRVSVPDWLSGAADAISKVVGSLAGANAWVPWAILGLGIGVVLGSIVVALVIRLVRIVASFVTLGGGGA